MSRIPIFMNPCQIVTFEPRYSADFARLNYAWIERLFGVEQPDRDILDHPESSVIEPGGQIFFAMYDGQTVGTAALRREDEWTFELCKMAVDDRYQGRGYARQLLEAALTWARGRQARQVELYSHSSLTKALALYRSAGFEKVSSACDVNGLCGGYARCDVYMRKQV